MLKSLRLRLTLLYTFLLASILLLFGVLVYLLIGILLMEQVDQNLISTAREILANSHVSEVGQVNVVTLPSLEMKNSVYVQVWGRDGQLHDASPSISQLTEPLAPQHLSAVDPIFSDAKIGSVHLRVLTAPLRVGERPIGVLQIATNLIVVDSARILLSYILAALSAVAILIAAGASWVSLGRTLRPLEAATETAEQITHADDLSRRIPYKGRKDDEIGKLIEAFNSSLERLENLFTSQQRFLADVSHELRTPLTVIKGNADLIRKFGPDDESLDSIRQEADRLTRLVGELLMLAQAESGRISLKLAPLELDSLVMEVFQEMRVLAGSKVTLKLVGIDQARVMADRDRLKQVLINLVANAIQYTPQGGQVTVNMTCTDDAVHISVQDTGPGIPKEDLPFIFDRFYRAEKSRTRSKATGFGLGLSIAYWIMERHGGTIGVESQEGKGTQFTVTLPIA